MKTLLCALARRAMLVAALCAVVSLVAPLPAAAQDGRGSLVHDGLERSYVLHVPPSYDGATPAPLLVALHANASSGRAMQALTGLDEAADEAGMIVAYPDSYDTGWAEDATNTDTVDDAGFIIALIDALSADYAIDPDQVFLTGFANGGLMAFRLACEQPQRFAGIATVGPLMWHYHREGCPAEAAAPVNLLMIYGNADMYYTGETHRFNSPWEENPPLILGVEHTLEFWTARNECEPAQTLEAPGENRRIIHACADDTTTAIYEIEGGKQFWPRTGDYVLNQFGLDINKKIMAFFAGDDTWMTPQPLFPDGWARTWTVYVPSSYDPASPMPAVVTLHGRFGSGAGTAVYTGMNDIAEEHGFIAIYPDGLVNDYAESDADTGWNYIKGSPYYMDIEPDDAVFLANLLDDLSRDLNIDRTRVYVNGMSNGGFMVHNLACRDPENYAAYATVAGSAYMGLPETCQTGTPVPMLIIHGTADDNIPWAGRTAFIAGEDRYVSAPIQGVFAFWVERNGCNPEVIETEDLPASDPDTHVRILAVHECPHDVDVVLYAIFGGGHNWPGIQSEYVENVNMDINAGEVMWDFFSQYARPARME
jgi:polyhydroxybutyrate depolymerase